MIVFETLVTRVDVVINLWQLLLNNILINLSAEEFVAIKRYVYVKISQILQFF